MRLINTETLQLSEFFNEAVPRYAILSHCWADDEVSFTEFKNGAKRDSKGFAKIVSCCTIARSQGLDWAWVDTCCIDKTSSAELSEAINSMFAWYADSAVCYVFLMDYEDCGSESYSIRSRGLSSSYTNSESVSEERTVKLVDRILEGDAFVHPGLTVQQVRAWWIGSHEYWKERGRHLLLRLRRIILAILASMPDREWLVPRGSRRRSNGCSKRGGDVESRPTGGSDEEGHARGRSRTPRSMSDHPVECERSAPILWSAGNNEAEERDHHSQSAIELQILDLQPREGGSDRDSVAPSPVTGSGGLNLGQDSWSHSSSARSSSRLGTSVSSGMHSSRWFRRGWTLQELIAPRMVLFFDMHGVQFGDKYSLARELSDITGIGVPFLTRQEDLSSASIACRMSWASNRVTTRTEDVAYSLLGIFGINMPLLYGEGSKAFMRLQEAILRSSDDESIFAWETKLASYEPRGLFARHPREFARSGAIIPMSSQGFPPHQITSKGVEFHMANTIWTTLFPAATMYTPKLLSRSVTLSCGHRADSQTPTPLFATIKLARGHGKDQWSRVDHDILTWTTRYIPRYSGLFFTGYESYYIATDLVSPDFEHSVSSEKQVLISPHMNEQFGEALRATISLFKISAIILYPFLASFASTRSDDPILIWLLLSIGLHLTTWKHIYLAMVAVGVWSRNFGIGENLGAVIITPTVAPNSASETHFVPSALSLTGAEAYPPFIGLPTATRTSSSTASRSRLTLLPSITATLLSPEPP